MFIWTSFQKTVMEAKIEDLRKEILLLEEEASKVQQEYRDKIRALSIKIEELKNEELEKGKFDWSSIDPDTLFSLPKEQVKYFEHMFSQMLRKCGCRECSYKREMPPMTASHITYREVTEDTARREFIDKIKRHQCTYCKKYDHMKFKCPVLKSKTCSACGKHGHTQSHCKMPVGEYFAQKKYYKKDEYVRIKHD